MINKLKNPKITITTRVLVRSIIKSIRSKLKRFYAAHGVETRHDKFLLLYTTAYKAIRTFISENHVMIFLVCSIIILSAIPKYVYSINNPYIEPEIPVEEEEDYYNVQSFILTSTIRDNITSEIIYLVGQLPNYRLPVEPVPFITSYTHFTFVSESIEERYRKDPEKTMAEVESLRQAIEKIWSKHGVNASISLDIIEGESTEVIILHADPGEMYDNHDVQIKYIEGDEESYQIYMEYLELKKTEGLLDGTDEGNFLSMVI